MWLYTLHIQIANLEKELEMLKLQHHSEIGKKYLYAASFFKCISSF